MAGCTDFYLRESDFTMLNKQNNPGINLDGPVVLISRDITYVFPFAYAYLVSYLKQQGETNVKILFRPSWGGLDKFVKEIMELKPLVVGFGSLYPELKIISELIEKLDKAGRRFPVVIGGQMVSPIPEFALKITKADIGIIGEGEITLFKLVKALREGNNLYNIRGLAIREKDNVAITGPGEFIDDLSLLPKVSYELFPEEKWLPIGRYYANKAQPHWRFNDRVLPIHGGRGCPFNCNFCYHHSKFRYRSINSMIEEAREGIERFNANMLYFADDLAIFNPQRAEELVGALNGIKKPVEYSISLRFDVLERINDDLLKELRRSGCRIMGLGIESGSQRILNLMEKKISLEQVKSGLRRLKDTGILPTVSIMVGQPSETIEDVQASIKLMQETTRDNKNIQYTFTIATPFPGSPLYSLALEKNYISSDQDFYNKYSFKRGKSFQLVVNFSGMDDKKLLSMHKKIGRIYRKIKREELGVKVVLIESLRGLLYCGNYALQEFIAPVLAKRLFIKPLKKIYCSAYRFMQQRLDNWRLFLRGITV